VAWRWLAARVHTLATSMCVGTHVVHSVYLPISKGVEVLHAPCRKGAEPADQSEQQLPIEDGPKAKSLPRVLAVELRKVGNSLERGSSI
jgi:hypothetical protein